jgi:hypothetical protein
MFGIQIYNTANASKTLLPSLPTVAVLGKSTAVFCLFEVTEASKKGQNGSNSFYFLYLPEWWKYGNSRITSRLSFFCCVCDCVFCHDGDRTWFLLSCLSQAINFIV